MSTERRRNVAASSSNGCTQLGTLCGAALVASRSTCSNMSRQLLVKGVPAIQHAYVHKCTQLARCAVLLAQPQHLHLGSGLTTNVQDASKNMLDSRGCTP